ncbi:MAG: sugar nucleotide-binding protein [Candidatus Omnitrophota bacterium]
MNKNILVFGKGFIGKRIKESLDCAITEKRINSFSDVVGQLDKFKPKIIINCIGYTGKNNVDDCEQNKDKTLFANTYIPLLFAESALRKNIKLIHISSGCIYHFDYKKDKPIVESDQPNFFDLYYSRSKIYAEKTLTTLFKKANVLIPRIRIPLDNRPHPKNILTKLLSFEKIVDVPNSVTYLPDFMEMLKHLIKIDAKGVYNTVNKGSLRYPQLLEVYKKYKPDYQYQTMDAEDLNKTRTNLILSTKKLEEAGFKVKDIHEVLSECVKEYLKS